MAQANDISRAVARAAREAGFTGGPRTWRRAVPVGLAVLNLQKSSWGDQYYVNFGIYVSALGAREAVRVEECHYYARAESLDRERERYWQGILDLDHAMEGVARSTAVTDLLTTKVFPFLAAISTIEGLRIAAQRGELTQAFTLVLKRHLGLA